jgi:hypothetical protein
MNESFTLGWLDLFVLLSNMFVTSHLAAERVRSKKIYRLKEDQAFSLSLELEKREEKKLRGILLQISSFPL